MARMDRNKAFDLANDLVPSGHRRGDKINELASKLLTNPWLNMPEPIEISITIKKYGFSFEKDNTIYTERDIPAFTMLLADLHSFIKNNLDKP